MTVPIQKLDYTEARRRKPCQNQPKECSMVLDNWDVDRGIDIHPSGDVDRGINIHPSKSPQVYPIVRNPVTDFYKQYILVPKEADTETTKMTLRPSGERHANPPAWGMFDAPLKQVETMRLKSLATGNPSANRSPFGTTVQPSRTPVKPAYLEKDEVSMATCNTQYPSTIITYIVLRIGWIKLKYYWVQKCRYVPEKKSKEKK